MKKFLALFGVLLMGCNTSVSSDKEINPTIQKFIADQTIVSDLIYNVMNEVSYEGVISSDAKTFIAAGNDHIPFKFIDSTETSISYLVTVYEDNNSLKMTWKLTEITAAGGNIEYYQEATGCPDYSKKGTFTFK